MIETGLCEDDLWVGEMRGVVVSGQPVLIVRQGAGVFAYRDRCPHQGQALSEGELKDGVITCRAHRHCFDASTGQGINPSRPCLLQLALRVQDGRIAVEAEPARSERLPP